MKRKSKQILSGLMALGIAAAAPMAAQALTFAPVKPNTVDVNVDSGTEQDVSSAPAAPATVSTETIPVTVGITANVIPTGIRADSVFNTKGYANLVQDAVMSNPYADPWESGNEVVTSRQVALMDWSGNVLLPFRKSYNNFYCYTDGIVSLTGRTPYRCMDEVFGVEDNTFEAFEEYGYYYDLSGNELFRTTGYSSPISEGYGILIDGTHSYEDNSSIHTYIINGQGIQETELFGDYTVSRFTGDIIGNGYVREIGLFCNGLAQVTQWSGENEVHVAGYMNTNGEMVLDLSSFDYIKSGNFEAELTWAGNGGDLGFIDRAGNLVIPYQYESAYPFTNDGMTAVKKDGKWGYIDAANNTVIPFMYDDAFGIYNGLAAVGLDGKYGYVDGNNQVIVPLEYDDISTFENGVGYAIKDGYVYIITKQ